MHKAFRSVRRPHSRLILPWRGLGKNSLPAVQKCPRASGRPDTHRRRTDKRSVLGAIAAHGTAGRDVAWHGPQGSDGASELMRHPWTYVPWPSSGDVRDIGMPSPALDSV